MNLEDKAERNFNSGYNCAESVLLALASQQGVTRQGIESFIPRIATGFGGGIARNGDVCGALTGGILAVGLALGRDKPDEARDPCYRAADQLYNNFLDTFNTCRCSQLTKLDLKTPNEMEAYGNKIHNECCNAVVAWVANKAYQIISKSIH
jgi:C_GCAxxG_C_C family probable redox protein